MNGPVDTQPTCWVIAGPNGAGKTTFALDFLPDVAHCRHFINADLIAAGLSPLEPDKHTPAASRLYLAEIRRCVDARVDFGFETTLSGKSYLRLIGRLQKNGWHVELIYLALPDVAMSRQRVAERVAHGGHDIPATAIDRRFARSLHNLFTAYTPLVDKAQCHMNAGEDTNTPVFVCEDGQLNIINASTHQHLRHEAGL